MVRHERQSASLYEGSRPLPEADGPFVYRFRTAPFHGAETGSTPVRAIFVMSHDSSVGMSDA